MVSGQVWLILPMKGRPKVATVARGVRPSPPKPGASRALLADIVESSNDAIFSRSLDGTITSWNQAAERIFGYRADEIIGRPSSVLLPTNRLEESREVLRKVRRGNRVVQFETIRMHKDGSPRHVSLCVSPIRNYRNAIAGASTIARDITVERTLEARLVEAGEQERQRLGRDLHDSLGQQLGGIELLCRTLARSLGRRRQPETRMARLLVKEIQSTIAQTRALAHGLATLVDSPDGLMIALENLSRDTTSLTGARCVFRCEEPVLISNHSAAVHLFRIAQEAVSNALRHGRARTIEIVLSEDGPNLHLSIGNNGLLPPTDIDPEAGTGLEIMRYRAATLGGAMEFKRTKPRGTQVSVSVPMPIPDEPKYNK
jgi:PAS domain S-box-containing protein